MSDADDWNRVILHARPLTPERWDAIKRNDNLDASESYFFARQLEFWLHRLAPTLVVLLLAAAVAGVADTGVAQFLGRLAAGALPRLWRNRLSRSAGCRL